MKLKSRAVYHTPLSTRVVILGNERYWSMFALQRLIAVCFVNCPYGYSKYCGLWKRYWISHTSNPSVCVGEPERKIPMVFIVVDSQNFKRQGIDFFSNSRIVLRLSKWSEYFTQRIIKMLCALIFLWLFRIPRALKVVMNTVHLLLLLLLLFLLFYSYSK